MGKRIVLVLCLLVVTAAWAQEDPIVALTTLEVNVRADPGQAYPVMANLPARTPVHIQGRSSAANWALVETRTGDAFGWVAVSFLILEEDVDFQSVPVVPSENPADATSAAPYAYDARVAKLLSVPVLPEIGPRVGEIFAAGQANGKDPAMVAKVGDCLTSNPVHLVALAEGDYELGPYAHLQAAIDYYREGFARELSVSVHNGFTMHSELDPEWADPSRCQPGESPLACEYRLIQPSVSLILLGGMDIKYYEAPWFEVKLREAVDLTVQRGIIPVLHTYPATAENWDQLLNINLAVVKVADEYGLPMVNLWLAVLPLPNHGLGQDDTHLSFKGARGTADFNENPYQVSLKGEEDVWGQTLHTLLTLQTLERIRCATQPAACGLPAAGN